MSEPAMVYPIAVTPRGHRSGCTASLPIDRLLMPRVRSHKTGVVLITAPPGGGKTFALEYLRRVLPKDLEIGCFDSHDAGEAFRAAESNVVILATANLVASRELVDVLHLSAWTLDDCMEYLLARHRVVCKSVMERLVRDATLPLLQGSPQLLAAVLDRMSSDERLDTCQNALRNSVRKIFPSAVDADQSVAESLSDEGLKPERSRWWRHEIVQTICVAGWIVPQLASGYVPPQLRTVNAALIPEIAAQLRFVPTAIDCLEQFVQKNRLSTETPMAASILLAANPDWRPVDGRGMNLCNAHLPNARWAGVALAGSLLMSANLAGADLSGSNLSVINADIADLSHANLRGSILRKSRFVGANLTGAELSEVEAAYCDFTEACLESAMLNKGGFDRATFEKTNLTNARCSHAIFSHAYLLDAQLRDAVFAGASLVEAELSDLDLSEANWSNVSFAKARFQKCNLEYLDLPSADFANAKLEGCLFTGTRIIGGIFTGANLRNTGLAEVHWQNADLREADLTRASFHLGSSRSGLVGSTIAGEGSRTGFYTDDYKDRDHKEAEEIRKACLLGANLLGAKVHETDFYLVDLRQAIYTPRQRRHFHSCAAILD